MSDKLRPGVSVTPEFVDGETPPAAKLNSISVQMKYAAEQVEKAIGDIHSQSWPYSATNLTTLSPKYPKHRTNSTDLSGTAERTLDIANVARLIGPASNMNPRTLHAKVMVENVAVGLYEFALRFPTLSPLAAGTVFSDDGPGGVYETYFADPTTMKTAGEYHVSADGKVYSVSPSAGGTVTYITTPASYGGGMNAQEHRFNVIPDPNQIASGGVGLSFGAPDAQGRRTATLPVATHAQSNWEGTSVTLGTDDLIEGVQLKLPVVLVDSFTAGEEIPPGYLFVKNNTTNKVYEDATYYFNNDTTFLILEDDLTTDIAAGHTFSAITVGNDITSAIDDLRVKSYHSHDRSFGEPFVSVDSITGFIGEAGNTGSWVPSEIPGNFAPQYLHRDGWFAGVDVSTNDMNAMRGPLLMGTISAPGTGINAGGPTHAVLFGNANVNISATANDLRIEMPDSVNRDVIIGATSSGYNGGHLILEGGMGGNEPRGKAGLLAGVGSYVNAESKPLFSEVTFLDGTVTNTINLVTLGLALTDNVYGYELTVKGSNNTWYHEGAGGTAEYTSVLSDTGAILAIVYTPDVGATLFGANNLARLVVWYNN